MEHPRRSMAKSITWRIFSFMMTVCIIFAYTRNIKQAIGVGAGIDIVKLGLYYAHERLWNKVKFGRKSADDYQI